MFNAAEPMMGEVEGPFRLYGVLFMLQLKSGSAWGVSHEKPLIWATVINTFLALCT